MLGCLVFVFSCILANVSSIILVTWKKEEQEKLNVKEETRQDETDDDIDVQKSPRELFMIDGMMERLEIKQMNVTKLRTGLTSMKKARCFQLGQCSPNMPEPAAGSQMYQVFYS